MDEFKKLNEYTDGHNRTGQVYLTNVGKSRFMALLYDTETDYNDAKYFEREEDAEICADDWVKKHE
jgi:hypothetical protein